MNFPYGKEKEEVVNTASIIKSRKVYMPGKSLKQILNTLEYEKQSM